MIKLAQLLQLQAVICCFAVLFFQYALFHVHGNRLIEKELQDDGLSQLREYRASLLSNVNSLEVRLSFITDTVEGTVRSEVNSLLEKTMDKAINVTENLSIDVLFYTNLKGEVILDYSSLTVAPPLFISKIHNNTHFRYNWAVSSWNRIDSYGAEEINNKEVFLILKKVIYDNSHSKLGTLYGGIRLTGESGLINRVKTRMDAKMIGLKLPDQPLITAPQNHAIPDNLLSQKGAISMQDNGTISNYYIDDLNTTSALINAVAVIKSESSLLTKLKDEIGKSYIIVLAISFFVLALIYWFFRKAISKSVNQVLNLIHSAANNERIYANTEHNNIAEFSQIQTVFYELTLKLDSQSKAMLKAQEEAVSNELIAKEKVIQMESLNEQMEQFIYGASHDLKSPLTSLQGLLDFTIMDVESGDLNEVVKNLNKMQSLVLRLGIRIEDTVAIVKADHLDQDWALVPLHSMVMKIWSSTPASIHGEVHLECHFDQQLQVHAIPLMLEGVLQNLIGNAVKYSQRNASYRYVRIEASIDEAVTAIRVCDNGVGIPENCRPRLFQMFAVFDDQGLPGSGLGLALVKKYMEKMHGTANYIEKNQGCCFEVSWNSDLTASTQQ